MWPPIKQTPSPLPLEYRLKVRNYSLVILEIRANQFGEYVCVASNIADTISSSARIQTEGKKLFSSNS